MFPTYLLNWLFQHFSQAYDLVSHSTYVACLKFIHNLRDIQHKVDFKRLIFEELFTEFYSLSEFLTEDCWWNIFPYFFSFEMSQLGLPSNQLTYYLLDHVDFKYSMFSFRNNETILKLICRAADGRTLWHYLNFSCWFYAK